MTRREDMERLRQQGKTCRDIASLYCISRQRVWQIIHPRPQWHRPLRYAHAEQVLTQLRDEFPLADRLDRLVKWAVNWAAGTGQSSAPAVIVEIVRTRLQPPKGRDLDKPQFSLHPLPSGLSARAILLTGVRMEELDIDGTGSSARVHATHEVQIAIPFFGGQEFIGVYRALVNPPLLRPIYRGLSELRGHRWSNEPLLTRDIAKALSNLEVEGPRKTGADFVVHLNTPVLLEAKVAGDALLRNLAQLMTYMYQEHVEWGLLAKATSKKLLLMAIRRQT